MKQSLRVALNLTEKEATDAEIRAQRIERDSEPDGANEYVPHHPLYGKQKYLGRETLKKILVDWRTI